MIEVKEWLNLISNDNWWLTIPVENLIDKTCTLVILLIILHWYWWLLRSICWDVLTLYIFLNDSWNICIYIRNFVIWLKALIKVLWSLKKWVVKDDRILCLLRRISREINHLNLDFHLLFIVTIIDCQFTAHACTITSSENMVSGHVRTWHFEI